MKAYLLASAERAFKTGVQFLLAEIGLLQTTVSTNDLGNWAWAFPLVGVGLSFATSFLSRYVGDPEDPSLV